MEDINRIKVVLVEKKRTSKWLSEQIGVTPSTVSKWCTNSSQPDLGNLLKKDDTYRLHIFAPKKKNMATNKNALIRYKHLDMLLSDRHHYYDINDLTEKVNDMLYDDGFKTVTRRCIEKDLVYLTEAPFRAPIKHFKWNGKNCVAYKNASFSIFKQEMSKHFENIICVTYDGTIIEYKTLKGLL